MSPISVFVINALTKTMTVTVNSEGTVHDLRSRIIERNEGGCDYLVYHGKKLRDDSTLKEVNIQQNSTVTVLMRMQGGGLVDRETLFNVTCGELEDAVKQLHHTRGECAICVEEKRCTRYCHSTICDECLLAMCKTQDFHFDCVQCGQRKPVGEVIAVLKPYVTQYYELLELLRNVDVQVCRCGTMTVNQTLQSHARCARCGLYFCFFCRREWDRLTMRDDLYKCSDTCDGISSIVKFELAPFECSTAGEQKIPNRRPCPKCWRLGAYDLKCKYHRCTCKHEFCFMCMKSKSDCILAGGSYGNRCAIRELTPKDAPHLLPRV